VGRPGSGEHSTPSGGSTTTTAGHSEPCARWTVIAHPCRRSPARWQNGHRWRTGEGHDELTVGDRGDNPGPPLAKPSVEVVAVATIRRRRRTRQACRTRLSLALRAALRAAVPAGHGARCHDLDVRRRRAEDAGDRVGHQLHRRGAASSEPCHHDHHSRSGPRLGAAPRRVRRLRAVRWSRPRLGGARRELGDGTTPSRGGRQHPPGPDRRRWAGFADEHQVGSVGHRLDQRRRQLGVEHRRLVDDTMSASSGQSSPRENVPVVPCGPSKTVNGHRRLTGQLLEPLGRPAGRRRQTPIRWLRNLAKPPRRHGAALAGAGPPVRMLTPCWTPR